MFILKCTPESEVEKDRSDFLVYAIYYDVLIKDEIEKLNPHVVMFGRKHIGTILKNENNKWQLFNKRNFSKLYAKVKKKLNKILPKEFYDIYELVYPNKGNLRNYIDPVPDSLFNLGLSVDSCFGKDIDVEDDLSTVVNNIIPTWMHSYTNIDFVRYNLDKKKYEQVSLKKIREVEGYFDFLYSYNYQNYVNYDPEEIDYSIYK